MRAHGDAGLPAPKRGARYLRIFLVQCAIVACVLGLLELGFRAGTDAPHGYFRGWFRGAHGLYPESTELPLPGFVPWIIKTNRWGLRGDEIAVQRTRGTVRIAMVGDSVTDSLFVENENTFPAMTAARLASEGVRVEVLNAGYSGITIDRELAILREVVSELEPDVVVLTFVTNDIDALAATPDEKLLSQSLRDKVWQQEILRPITVHTALGEWLFDRYLHLRSSSYRTHPWTRLSRESLDPRRYEIPGGGDFENNARIFLDMFRKEDARVLTRELSPDMQIQVARYLRVWDVFMNHARTHRMKPVFVYFPAYPQVYVPDFPMTIRDVLKRHSEESGVPFLDLTGALRGEGATVLHLAPADFHLNPAGNRVIGKALADFLIAQGLVQR